jgi:F0F1-type ATP synthase epsilon subunit
MLEDSSFLTVIFQAPLERKVISNVGFIDLPGQEGRLGILPKHAAIIVGLKAGITKLFPGGKEYYISGGKVFVERDHCLILTEFYKKRNEMDKQAILSALEEMQGRLEMLNTTLEVEEESVILNKKIKILQDQLTFI